MKKTLIGIAVCGMFLASSTAAFAQMKTVVQTYDITPAACEGLELDGVNYAFTVAGAPSADCVAGTFVGPGFTNNIEPPNIEGTSAGVLHLTFAVPTTKFGFGVAQDAVGVAQEVVIQLNRPGVGLLRETVNLEITDDPLFVGGRYDYDGPAVKTVSVYFTSTQNRFALDNTTYFRPPGKTK